MIGFGVNELQFRSGAREAEPLFPGRVGMLPELGKPRLCLPLGPLPGAMASAAPHSERTAADTERRLGPGREGPSSERQLSASALPSTAPASHVPEPHIKATRGFTLKLPRQAGPGGPLGTRLAQPQPQAPPMWGSPPPRVSLPAEELRMCPSCCPCSPQAGEAGHKSRFILWTNKC